MADKKNVDGNGGGEDVPPPPANRNVLKTPNELSRRRWKRSYYALFAGTKRSREITTFWLQIGSVVVTLFGAGFGLGQYIKTSLKERQAAVQAIYDRVDEKYTAFLNQCTEHPWADCDSVPSTPTTPLDGDRVVQQRLIYAQLIDVFEVTFVRYTNESYNSIIDKGDQWLGWVVYMEKFAVRKNFRATWLAIANEFDSGFAACLTKIVETAAEGGPMRSDAALRGNAEIAKACRIRGEP